jgi:hypothetical protein
METKQFDISAPSLATVAAKYIGKTEKPGNAGFKDANFEKVMKEVGFVKGHAWCAYFAELACREWARGKKRKDIEKLVSKYFSGGSTKTFKNMELATEGSIKISKKPVANSVVIFRYGNGWQGHTAIVESVDSKTKTMTCIEGNTNDKGGREGYIVARRKRKYNAPYASKGLNIVGYFYFSLS